MKINIESIPNSKQRYETVGDYWLDKNGVIQVRVSQFKDERYEWLILIHELTEMLLTKFQGVSWNDIDIFDFTFKGKNEPGDDRKAPYYHQHQVATKVEKLVAKDLKINFKEYIKESVYDTKI